MEKTVKVSPKSEIEELCLSANPAVMIVIDVSGSMADRIPGGVKIEIAKSVVEYFLQNIPMNVDVGLIAFSDKIELSVPITSNRSLVLNAVKRLKAKGGTMYTYPLMSTLASLRPYRAFNVTALVIFVTDGLPADLEYRSLLKEFSSLKIPIYTVFIGNRREGIGETKFIAEKTGGKQYTATTASELLKIFKELSNTVTKITIKSRVKITYRKKVKVKYYLSQYFALASLLCCLLLFYTRYRCSRVSF